VTAWIRQYSAPNVVGARKLKALNTINPLLYEKRPLCIFEPLSGGLRATYGAHLRLIRKLVVDFLLVIIELFSLGSMVHALQLNFDSKSPILKGLVTLAQNFR